MNKKPSEKAETLARQLQEKLRHQRPRWLRWVPLMALVLFSVLLALAWILYPTPETPRLLVTALDALVHDGEASSVTAWLDPQEPQAFVGSLEGFTVFFGTEKGAQGQPEQSVRLTTHANGEAMTEIALAESKTPFHVRLLDPRKKYENRDMAMAYRLPRDTPLLLVDVEETLADIDVQSWAKVNPLNIGVRAGAQEALQAAHLRDKYAIVYLATGSTPAKEYRRVRGWVRLKNGVPTALPEGPVLGRLRYDAQSDKEARGEVLADLRQRFTGPMAAVVRTSEAAEQCVALGIRAFAMGGGDFPAPVTPIKGWQDLPALVTK